MAPGKLGACANNRAATTIPMPPNQARFATNPAQTALKKSATAGSGDEGGAARRGGRSSMVQVAGRGCREGMPGGRLTTAVERTTRSAPAAYVGAHEPCDPVCGTARAAQRLGCGQSPPSCSAHAGCGAWSSDEPQREQSLAALSAGVGVGRSLRCVAPYAVEPADRHVRYTVRAPLGSKPLK